MSSMYQFFPAVQNMLLNTDIFQGNLLKLQHYGALVKLILD